MHIIGFSHHYHKLHNQTHGILLSARILCEEEFRKILEDRATVYFDSAFSEGDNEFVAGIGEDERVQLVFIGNRQIPFTTYRKIPESHVVRVNGRILTPRITYLDLVGSKFAFKFKGEELPPDLAASIDQNSVKIFS